MRGRKPGWKWKKRKLQRSRNRRRRTPSEKQNLTTDDTDRTDYSNWKSVSSVFISGKVFDFVGCVLKQSPGLLHVVPCGAEVADGETNDLLMVEYGSGDEHPAGVVDAVHDGAVVIVDLLGRVAGVVASEAEADHAERHGRDDLEALLRVAGDQRGEVAGPLDVLAQHGLDAVAAKVAQHEPEFEGAEAVAERDTIIHQVVGSRVGLGFEVVRRQRKGAAQNVRPSGEEGAEINGSEQPFMSVEDQGVRAFHAGQDVAMLRQHGGSARVGGVNVNPESVLFRNVNNGAERVNAGGTGGADGGNNAERPLTRRFVLLNQAGESRGVHAKLRVAGNLADVVLANANRDGALLNGHVRLVRGVKHKVTARAFCARFRRNHLSGADNGVHAAGGSGVVHNPKPFIRQ